MAALGLPGPAGVDAFVVALVVFIPRVSSPDRLTSQPVSPGPAGSGDVRNPYETDRLRDEYLLFHYGRAEEVLPYPSGPAGALDFPARVVRDGGIDWRAVAPDARALDVGCAVGRASFELARTCREVVGIDFSHRFVQAAETLRDEGRLAYRRIDEGRLTTALTAHVPPGIDRTRVRFAVGDACNLPLSLGSFEVVIGVNLVDRLPAPRRFVDRLAGLLAPGGQLLLASPYTWLEEYTPSDRWLGGFTGSDDGQPVRTLDTLHRLLEPDFELTTTRDVPFLLREHARKFQWSVSQATCWRRRE